MKNPRIAMRFMRMTPISVLKYAAKVHTDMTANAAFFTDPTPTMAALRTAMDNLETAIAAATGGSKVQRNTRDGLTADMQQMLKLLSEYVTFKCAGDPVLMETSGFILTREPQRIGDLPQVINLRTINTGISGQLALKWNSVYGADSYNVSYSLNGSTEWTPTISTSARAVLHDLDPRHDYRFMVAAVGAKGQGPWSAEQSAFVL